MGYFFHLTPSRHQNIKTSLCARTKNGSVMPLFVIFRPVRKKLQLTVSFDHPVVDHLGTTWIPLVDHYFCHWKYLQCYMHFWFLILATICHQRSSTPAKSHLKSGPRGPVVLVHNPPRHFFPLPANVYRREPNYNWAPRKRKREGGVKATFAIHTLSTLSSLYVILHVAQNWGILYAQDLFGCMFGLNFIFKVHY